MNKPKNKQLIQFKEWLNIHGAPVMENTNPYEIVRFLSRNGVSIIYVNKNNTVTSMTGDAETAWDAFASGQQWDGGLKTKRNYRHSKKRRDIVFSLAERDGWTCTYCGALMTLDTSTIEHVVPLTRGGMDAINNMVLACKQCNADAGNMNIRQKMELMIRKRQRNYA